MPKKTILLTHREKYGPYRRFSWRTVRNMFRSVVTVAKVTLVFLNIWVLAVVLVVSLGHWRVFDSSDSATEYDNSHIIFRRELKETDLPSSNGSKVQNIQQVNFDLESLNERQPEEISLPASSNDNPQPHNSTSAAALPVTRPPSVAAHEDGNVANLRYWCKQQHRHKTPYDKIPKAKLSNILVDERHKLLYCQVPGVAINEWRKIMLILSGAVNATSVDSISGGDVYGKYAKLPKRLSEFGDKERGEMLKKFYKVIFVRDPLERLVIAFRTKLLSKGAKYFHRAYGSLIIKKYRPKATAAEIKQGSDVRFSEFVKFIIDNEHTGAEALNEHWEQYYKQCHPCLIDYDFVGKFESVEKDTKTVLDKVKASKSIKQPYVKDTKIIPQNELKKIYSEVTAKELNSLSKIYSADYTLFSYQCPNFVHEILKKGNIFHDY